MTGRHTLWPVDRRGIAAVEFALLAPVLLALLGGTIDFGLIMTGKSQLANGLAQGVEYTLLQGPHVLPAAIQAVVQNGSTRSGVSGAVTVIVTGPACYCASGQPVVLLNPPTALSATYTCAGTCPDASPRGTYVSITASYVYHPLMPFYSKLADTTVSKNAILKMQ